MKLEPEMEILLTGNNIYKASVFSVYNINIDIYYDILRKIG